MTNIGTVLIYSFLVLCVVIATFVRPAVAIAAILCTFGLEQWAQANSAFFTAHVALTNFVTAGILGLALVLMFFRGRPIFANYPAAGWWVIGLYALVGLSWFWSIYRPGTVDQIKHHLPYVLTVVILTPLLVTQPRDLRDGLMGTLVLGCVVLVLLAATSERSGGRGIDLQTTSLSSAKGAGNPLEIATLAGYIAITAVLMNFHGMARFWQVLRWVVFGLGVVLTINSGSRGQLIATFLTVVFFLPMSRRIKNLKGFVGTCVAVAVAGAFGFWVVESLSQSTRWQVDFMVQEYSATRLGNIGVMLSRWANGSPVAWLVGLGNSASFDPNLLGIYPHFVLVEILTEEGLVGLGLYLLVIGFAGRSIVRTYRMVCDDAEARGLLAAFSAMFLFDFILSFKQGSMLGSTRLFAFSIMLGRFERVVGQVVATWAVSHEPGTTGEPDAPAPIPGPGPETGYPETSVSAESGGGLVAGPTGV